MKCLQQEPNALRHYEAIVQGGDRMDREKLLYEKLHEALHLNNTQHWQECCVEFAQLGDPEAPDLDHGKCDDEAMCLEEIERLLAEGV
uniref:Uncharacterized protein n=1 Tax=Ulva partita TaxID=1605170 RepID=A0A1C9ZPX1_9CHLO|nr:hypothetical protein [Ulva partita]